MSLSSYLIGLDRAGTGDAPFVAIPAFVSRAFRRVPRTFGARDT
jgi:hypothetical protein